MTSEDLVLPGSRCDCGCSSQGSTEPAKRGPVNRRTPEIAAIDFQQKCSGNSMGKDSHVNKLCWKNRISICEKKKELRAIPHPISKY